MLRGLLMGFVKEHTMGSRVPTKMYDPGGSNVVKSKNVPTIKVRAWTFAVD